MRRKVFASPIQAIGHVALVCVAALCLPSSVSAGFGDLIVQLFDTNPAPEDRGGISVVTKGGSVLIGATGENSLAGLVFPYDANASFGAGAFASNSTMAGDVFGTAVDIDPVLTAGGLSLVGAPGVDTQGSDSGAAYLYDATTNAIRHTLLPTNGAAFDRFGTSVALGTIVDMAVATPVALVAADRDDDFGPASGSLFVFDATTGSQVKQINASDGAADDGFGRSIGMSNGIAIVGSPGDDDRGSGSGSAYLYDVATGAELKLLPDSGSDFAAFGWSVAIDGNFALVGAYRDDAQGQSSGSAYLFEVSTGNLLKKFTPHDGEAFDLFGISVALDAASGIALIGATGDDDKGDNAGAAYLFDINRELELAKLKPDALDANDAFGGSVSLDAGFGVVGASFDDDNGLNTGSVFLFNTVTSPLARPGDYNGDGVIDAADFTVWRDALETGDLIGDGDGDGDVDNDDYQVWVDAFIIDGSGPTMPIPEPAGAMLFVVGLAIGSLRRR